jgi:hypothetical protein
MNNSKLSALGIPSEFQCLNHTIKVTEVPDLPELGKYGDWCADTNEIRLFTQGVCPDMITHSFYHEVVHCLLERSAHQELSQDEQLVDLLGGLIAQYHQTLIPRSPRTYQE